MFTMNSTDPSPTPDCRPHRSGPWKAAAAALGLSFASALPAAADYFVDFESATKTSYASATVDLAGIDWEMTEALIGTAEPDWKNGAQSVRLRGFAASSLTMLEDLTGEFSSISFLYRRYGTDAQVTWAVDVSQDGGENWSSVGEEFTAPPAGESDEVQEFSASLDLVGNARFRIRSVDGEASNRRLNLDDLLIEFVSDEEPPPLPIGPVATNLTPGNGATNVPTDTQPTILFDRGILPGTGSILIKDAADDSVVEALDVADAERVIVFNDLVLLAPAAPLPLSKVLYIEVPAGIFVDAEAEEDGNEAFGGADSWSFSTPSPASFGSEGYAEDFAGFVSIDTIPTGWTFDGPVTIYNGVWGEGTSGGFRGNPLEVDPEADPWIPVLGYQHTDSTNELRKILTLINDTDAVLDDVTISYIGRVARADQTRDPAYLVTVNGEPVPALNFSTLDGDGTTRSASLSGLGIEPGGLLTIVWTSDGSTVGSPGSGARKQIGISDLRVTEGAAALPPSLAGMTVSPLTITTASAVLAAEVSADGGADLTARGFVIAQIAVSSTPALGDEGVVEIADEFASLGAFEATATLEPDTSYSVRAYASNSEGTAYSATVTFTTLPLPPTFTGSYLQTFDDFSGTLPLGWNGVSSGGVNGYGGDFGTGTAGGFRGGEGSPGVLGYQHTGSSGDVIVTLSLINDTGAALESLFVSYLGRVAREDEGRHPAWTVAVNGETVEALAYSTEAGSDQFISAELTGLSIAPGEVFSITWTSDRGFNAGGSSRQIGLTNVSLSLEAPEDGYLAWALANAGGQGPDGDFDLDGVPNGVEYFFGETGSGFTPNPQIVDGSITWPRDPSRTVASFKVEISNDLDSWTDVAEDDSSLTVTANSVSFELPEADGPWFVRLRVTP